MVDQDILVITHPLEPASESHVADLLAIISAITSVTLVTVNLRDDSNIRSDHEVIDVASDSVGDSIPVAALRFLRNQLRMCRTIWNRDESIVLFFGATSYLLPILCARILGRTVVLEPRGDVPLTLRLQWEQRVSSLVARVLAGSVWLLERTGYRLADGIITYTPAMAEQLKLDTYSHKLHPEGARHVDDDRFYPYISFGERDHVIGFLGRLDEEKGIRDLAEVAQNLPDNITFRFIGDGDLRGWLESELEDEIERGTVEITGWVDHNEVPEKLSELRLLVLPSHPTEGLPTVILESLACGTPVYATPVSGVPDVVREGETGFLIRESSPAAISERITEICQQEDLATLSENGRERIEREFSFNVAINRYRRILKSL